MIIIRPNTQIETTDNKLTNCKIDFINYSGGYSMIFCDDKYDSTIGYQIQVNTTDTSLIDLDKITLTPTQKESRIKINQ